MSFFARWRKGDGRRGGLLITRLADAIGQEFLARDLARETEIAGLQAEIEAMKTQIVQLLAMSAAAR